MTMRHDTSNEGIDGNVLYSEQGLWDSIIDAVPFRVREIQNESPLAGLTGLRDHPKATNMQGWEWRSGKRTGHPTQRHFSLQIRIND